MELTESKGIVMTTIALDEREVKEIAALPPEAVAQRVGATPFRPGEYVPEWQAG